MTEKLTNIYVEKLKPGAKRIDIRDAVISKLILRVEPSGKKTYLVDYSFAGRRNTEKIGDASILNVSQAREKAREFLASITMGNDPSKNGASIESLGDLIDDHYAEWSLANRKSGEKNLKLLRSSYGFLMSRHPESITLLEMEKWRVRLRKTGTKLATINRKTTALKALLNWGVKHKLLTHNPVASLPLFRETDSERKIRYLSEEERIRLFEAIDTREERICQERDSHNAWLQERGFPPLPSLRGFHFVDHLKPAVIVALNTGMRQGSLFSLQWSDVGFDEGVITLRASTTKAGKMQVIPMNRTVLDTLGKWREQSLRAVKVFNLKDCRTSWRNVLKMAGITNFRWHDMRHDFASQLVMRGVDLNTVRELLGHADLKMTLRYAHLAPDVKKRAVDLLE